MGSTFGGQMYADARDPVTASSFGHSSSMRGNAMVISRVPSAIDSHPGARSPRTVTAPDLNVAAKPPIRSVGVDSGSGGIRFGFGPVWSSDTAAGPPLTGPPDT